MGRNYSSAKRRRQSRGTPCPYCNCDMQPGRKHPSPDHVWPRSRGGVNSAENLVMVCQPCNQDKAALPLIDWLAKLRAAGDRRAFHVERFIRDGMHRVPAELASLWRRSLATPPSTEQSPAP